MLLLLYLFWLILCGRFSLALCLAGLPVCAAAFAFSCRFCGWSGAKEKNAYRLAPLALRFLGLLLLETLSSNLAVLKLILFGKKGGLAPRLFLPESALKSRWARSVLACAISLTPGTLAVRLTEDRLLAHALNDGLAGRAQGSALEQCLVKMERLTEKGGTAA